MEKFTAFSDQATGVNPFVPLWANAPKYNPYSLSSLLSAFLIFPVRVVLVTVGLLWLFVAWLLLLPLLCRPLSLLLPSKALHDPLALLLY